MNGGVGVPENSNESMSEIVGAIRFKFECSDTAHDAQIQVLVKANRYGVKFDDEEMEFEWNMCTDFGDCDSFSAEYRWVSVPHATHSFASGPHKVQFHFLDPGVSMKALRISHPDNLCTFVPCLSGTSSFHPIHIMNKYSKKYF